jgi:hypothetical protein
MQVPAGGVVSSRVPAELASPSYAELVARVAELEKRLAATVEQREAAAVGWVDPPFPPPPPPPVEVRPAAPAPLALGSDGTAGEEVPSDGAPGRVETPHSAADVEDLADRIGDVERRLARIEAELGALR